MSEKAAAEGMRAQMELRTRMLAEGARPLGWKIGMNPPAVHGKLGLDAPVVGFLTDRTLVESGATFAVEGRELRVEAELGLEIGADGASVVALMPALEIVEFDRPLEQIDAVIAEDVFHRGVVLGPRSAVAAAGAGTFAHNGEQVAELDASKALDGIVELAARRLGEGGERLSPGDVVIAGALVPPVQVSAGDTIRIELEPLGAAEVAFS